MNNQNETAQLRFLEETAIRLRQNGFTVEPIEDHHLPVCWEKGRLCRISGKGSVLYRQERVDVPGAQDALQAVIDTAKMTSEYMAILETAPRLKASGLTGDYRVLADFGDAVLAGHPTERGVQFVTWEWDFDREGVHHGHYSRMTMMPPIKILLATAFRTPDEKDSLQLRRFVVFLRPSQSWVNILRQLRLTLDITIVGNLPASKSNFAFDILSILIGNGQP